MALTIKQWNAYLAVLLQNVDLEVLEASVLQKGIVDDPKRAGAEFTKFLTGGARCSKVLVVKRPDSWRIVTPQPWPAEQFLAKTRDKPKSVSDYARSMMQRPEFRTLKVSPNINLALATVGNLGFTDMPTTAELWARIAELGGKLLPPEVGPQLLLDLEQLDSEIYLAMEPIRDLNDQPSVFSLGKSFCGLSLHASIVCPQQGRWKLDGQIVFSFGE